MISVRNKQISLYAECIGKDVEIIEDFNIKSDKKDIEIEEDFLNYYIAAKKSLKNLRAFVNMLNSIDIVLSEYKKNFIKDIFRRGIEELDNKSGVIKHA